MQLSRWQRIKRRFALMGGSYTYPNGKIELDFEAKAGIDPFNDDEDVRERKLQAYQARQMSRTRMVGAGYIAVGMYFINAQIGFATWEAIAVAGLIGMGMYFLVSPPRSI